jgi:hypothetical protein
VQANSFKKPADLHEDRRILPVINGTTADCSKVSFFYCRVPLMGVGLTRKRGDSNLTVIRGKPTKLAATDIAPMILRLPECRALGFSGILKH